jgi:hypothetical protein
MPMTEPPNEAAGVQGLSPLKGMKLPNSLKNWKVK